MGEAMTPAGARFPAVRALARGWWLFLLRGIVGVLFGVLIFLFPGAGLALILGFLAAWLLVDGVASLVQAVRGGADPTGLHRSRTWLGLDGVLSVLLALVVLLLPGLSAVALVVMVGVWAILVGGFRMVLGWRAGDWLLGLLPWVGASPDFFFRSNTRNLRIIKRHLDKHHADTATIETTATKAQ